MRYLLVSYSGGTVEVAEVTEEFAVKTVEENSSKHSIVLERLRAANNGDTFQAWYHEDAIIVLVD
jgi:hypothetical protein